MSYIVILMSFQTIYSINYGLTCTGCIRQKGVDLTDKPMGNITDG
jgi:hypothetical protein